MEFALTFDTVTCFYIKLVPSVQSEILNFGKSIQKIQIFEDL